MDNFENYINNDSFLKNIKRMFITKQMELYNIKQFTINFDNETKTFNFKIIKDDKNDYEHQYKIKRRKERVKENKNTRKKLKIKEDDYNNIKKCDNSTICDFNSKINISPCHISTTSDLKNRDNILSENINKENILRII